MAIIQSGAGSTLWTIDPSSNAGRVTVYNQNGTPMGSVSSLNTILNALNSATTIVLGGQATLGINVTGTTGTLTLSFEGSMDNVAWFPINANSLTGTGIITSTNADGYWIASTSGFYAVRTRISAYTSGSMNVSINLTPGASQNISQSVTGIVTTNIGTTGGLALDTTLTGGTQLTRLTDGTNTASVKAASTAAGATDKALVVAISPNNSVAVTGSFFQATQPVSGTVTVVQPTASNLNANVSGTVAATQSGTWTVQPGNTANTTPWLTTISQGGNAATVSAAGAIKIDGSAVTQPVSGTITANAGTGSFTVAQATAANLNATVVGTVTSNIGTTGGIALDATLTGGTQRNRITDGTNNAAVKAASTAAGATDPALVVAISPNNSVAVTGTFFQATQPVSGTVTANAGTGSFTVAQATAANLNATVVGTVTANVGTTNGLALDATLTGGTQRSKITDGTNNAAVKAASTAAATTDPALVVVVSPNNSVAVTGTFFQATQPVSGTVAATQSGTWTVQPGNTANTTPWLTTINQGGNSATVSAGGALKVDASATTQPVSGTVTANAGTGSFTVAQATAANLNATVVGSGNFTVVQATASNLNANVSGTVTSNIGTTNGLALDTTLTGGTARNRITDGTNVATVKAASTAPLATDTSLVVAISPNSSIVTNADGYVTTAAPSYTNNTFQSLSLTTVGALRTDSSAVTQPVSGTITANAGTGSFTVAQATAANLNATVTGTVAATQSGTWTVQPGNTANTTPWLSTINQGGNSATVSAGGALKVDGSAVTQPVSGTITANAGTGSFTVVQATAANLNATVTGTVTANVGTTNGLALDATLTGGTQRSKLTDGTNNAAVKAASTAAATTDPALVVAISPNNSVAVTGTFFQATQPVSGTGSFTVAQGTAANLNATVVGTVTSNIGTTNGLALDATLAKLTIAQSTALGSNTQAMVAGSVTTAAPTYTTGNINPLSLTTAGALRVDASATTQPISGTVTANAGTGSFTVVQATAANLNATVTGTVAATQSGTWTVQPGNTANTTPWLSTINQGGNSATVSAGGALKTDSSATTQPVSGTVTANAGTGSFTVVQATAANLNATVVGSGSFTVVQATASNLNANVSGTVTANAGTGNFTVAQATAANLNATIVGTATDNTTNSTAKLPVMSALANTASPTWTNGNMVPLSVDTTGALRITGSISSSNPSVTTTGSAPPGSATYIAGSVTTAAPTYTTGQMSGLSLTTAGALRIDGSSTTQPVSGTITANAGTGSFTVAQATAANLNATVVGSGNFTVVQATAANLNATVTGTVAATQSGTWTVQPGNTANTTPWLSTINQGGNSATVSAGGALKVDGSAVTQPVSGTITANAGTGSFTVAQATAANLNATIVGTVTANIGTTNGLALDASVAKLTVAQSAALGTNTQTLMGGSVTTAAPTYTTGNINPLSLTTAGALRVDASGTTQPVSGTITANAGTGSFTVAQATAANLNATVVGSGNFTVVQATAANLNATVTGTVTSNQGTANTNANGWFTRLTDGTNNVAVKAASTQAAAADVGLVVSLNPTSAQTKASTATVAQVASSVTSVTLLAANANRLGAIIVNDSTQILFLKFGTTASSTSYSAPVAISKGTFEVPFGYTGIITGSWVSANGFAYCTEVTV